MNASEAANERRVVFVSRAMSGESLRVARAIASLEGVSLLGICEQLPEAAASSVFVDLISVTNPHDATQLVAAAQTLRSRNGSLDHIVTTQEPLLEPVAQAVAMLGVKGLSVDAVHRGLDKSRLKQILRQAGIKTARDRSITNKRDAQTFADEIGFPMILKPLGGSGGLATWCIHSEEELELALELMQPSADAVVLAEAYLRGEELCLDTITIANEPQFYSICCYRPSILTALENPGVQWSCIMPRDIGSDRYGEFIEQGLIAVRALSVGNAMTHMEGFMVDGGGVCFTDATLRPAGARIGPMLAFAYDIDPYKAWARVAVDGCFDGPWERKYAVGTIFLRGEGGGTVTRIDGMEQVTTRLESLLVDVRWPRPGAAKSMTYTGDGYITVRHPETKAVEEALESISERVHINYSNPGEPGRESDIREQWGQRLQYFSKQLNKPAWDVDVGVR